MFRAEFWPLQDEPGYAFVAAVRLPQTVDRSDNAELVLRGARGGDRDLRMALVVASAEAAFGKQVAASAGAHAARLTRFMLDVMRSDDGSDMRQPSAVLDAFLTHAARADGCVELIMHVPQRCVMLQGWGMQPADAVEIMLPGSDLARHAAGFGDFARSDVGAPATGNILVLPPDLAGAMTSLEKIYLLTGEDLLCRHVVEPRILDVEASIGQIRHLLPRLNCSAPLRALLRTTLQPHYDGQDTLNAAGRPVRAALDTAFVARGGGAYLSGWLFDPACHTAELHLCADGFAEQLNDGWVRVLREDVSAAFRADPAFTIPLNDEAGFTVAIPVAPPPDQPAYLRFTFTDGELAFVPVRFADASAPSSLRSLLSSVDLHKPSALSVITQHLAPFLAQVRSRAHETSGRIIHRGPLERARAVVVPLSTPKMPRSLISSFLLDPVAGDEQVIFVCGPEWDQVRRETLIGLIRFYQLPASVLEVGYSLRSADAMREAASLSEADSFLLTSPGVVGSAPGWRGSLHQAAGNDHVACPTVLFEDRSLRFGGPKSVLFLERAPFVTIHEPFAGACADLASAEGSHDVGGGTFACCLVQRSALPALEHASRFMTDAGQEAAFFLSLRELEMKSSWVPSVRVSAPEEEASQTQPALPLVDGWMLRDKWGEAASCVS